MIKVGLSNRYKVDPYGTEEILSEASVSLAPKLTIDYGDEVQEAEFTIRPTKGSLDTNISPVAVLDSIKGNTIAWNQLYDSSVPTALANHKYYLRESNSDIISTSVSTTISYTEDSTERNCIDLTIIYGTGNEPTTAAQFEVDYYKWFGKQLTYEDYDAGSLRSCKMSGIKTTDANSTMIGITSIPVTTLKGKLNGEGSSVVVFPNGIKSAGTVSDEIKIENGVAEAIKRVGSVDIGTLKWTGTGDSRGYFTSGLSTLVAKGDSSAGYVIGNYVRVAVEGDADLTAMADKASAMKLANGNLFIKDSSYQDAAAFKTAMSGVMVYYELATPEEYILDDISVEKIILGSTEATKVYLGNQLIFEESD